jgi:hypothetical protein
VQAFEAKGQTIIQRNFENGQMVMPTIILENHKCDECAETQEINKMLSSVIGSAVLSSLYI